MPAQVNVFAESVEDGNESEASSIAQPVVRPGMTPRFRDLVHLTGGHCRVLMTNRPPHRACGNLAGQCHRTNHNLKVSENRENERARTGYYVASETRRPGVLDGLLNEYTYTAEEAVALKARELREDQLRLDALRNSDNVSLREDLEEGDAGEATNRDATLPPQGGPGTADEDLLGATPPRPRQPATSPTLYLGMEQATTGKRKVLTKLAHAERWNRLGWSLEEEFDNPQEAEAWVKAARRPTPRGHRPTNGSDASPAPELVTVPGASNPPRGSTPSGGIPSQTFYGMECPRERTRVIAWSRADYEMLKDTGYVIRRTFREEEGAERWATGQDLRRLGQVHQHVTGPDTSNTALEVFGVHSQDYERMDSLLLPTGIPADERNEYYDCATDVMALPGGFRLSGDNGSDDAGIAEALFAMAQGKKEAGINVRYRSPTNNGLRRLKTGQDLPDFMESVQEASNAARTAMEGHLSRKLHGTGIARDDIETYMQVGGLPRLVRDTLANYQKFLTTLGSHINHMAPGESWNNSVAETVLKVHRDQLALIRETSSCYRDLILRNYTYMRDQARTSFWNEKLSRKSVVALRMGLRGGSPAGNTPSAASRENRCQSCGRAHTLSPCPVAGWTRQQKRRLMETLRRPALDRALAHIKEALNDDPSADVNGLITSARAAATGSS